MTGKYLQKIARQASPLHVEELPLDSEITRLVI